MLLAIALLDLSRTRMNTTINSSLSTKHLSTNVYSASPDFRTKLQLVTDIQVRSDRRNGYIRVLVRQQGRDVETNLRSELQRRVSLLKLRANDLPK